MLENGKRIPENLKEILKRLLTTDDLMDVADGLTVSYSTVRALYYRKAVITLENAEAVEALVKLAKDKASNAITFFNDAIDVLDQQEILKPEKTKEPTDVG